MSHVERVTIKDAAGDEAGVTSDRLDTNAIIADAGGDALAIDSSGRITSTIEDTAGDSLAIDASGRITALVQDAAGDALGIDSSGRTTSIIQDTAGDELGIDSSGRPTVNVVDGLALAKGDVTGTTYVHKFGEAPDFDTGDGSVTIWDGANDGGINQMAYQYSATADIDSLSSSSGSDTFDVEVEGLDTSWNLTTQTVTLTGQTRVAIPTALIRVFRMKNAGSASNVGDVYCYVNGSITAGVPDTATDVRAVMRATLNQTLMAVYTIPNGKKGYLSRFYSGLGGASKSADYIVDLFIRPSGGVFQIKSRRSMNETGNSSFDSVYEIPELISAQSDIEIKVNTPTVGVTGAAIVGGFDLTLVDD